MDLNATAGVVAPSANGYSVISTAVPTVALLVALFSWLLWSASLDPREPPLVTSWIPLVGHMIGMLWYHQRYYEILRSKYQLDIYTLKILGGRVYVVTKPELVSAVFRNSKSISFDPYTLMATKRLLGCKDETLEVFKKPAEIEGGSCYMDDAHRAMFESLASPAELLKMEKNSFAYLSKEINNPAIDGRRIKWYNWIRNLITRAAADAVFGPGNPAERDPSLIDRLWEFDDGVPGLMINFMPSITARTAYRARCILENAWEWDHTTGFINNAVALVHRRDETMLNYGTSKKEVMAWEYIIWFAPSTNSGPVLYWLLSYIFTNPSFLEDVRIEISKVALSSTLDGQKQIAFDIARIQHECPLLYAAWEETLRLSAPTVSVRMVTEDTILAEKYLLKKGAAVQMPSGVNHLSSAIWGPQPEKFDPRRMLKSTVDALPKEQQKTRSQAYWSWGGGRWKCPGQKFAIAELLPFAASILLAFDVRTAAGGLIQLPKISRTLTKNVDLPANDYDVVLRRREEFKDVRIRYVLSDGTEL